MPEGALECVLASNEYGTYCLPASVVHRSRERPIVQAVLEGRVHEADTVEALRAVDPDGDIVHAGAFFGDFIPALAKSRNNGAIVWAFEPGLESYRCAQITVLLNALEGVVLTHAGLGAKRSSAFLTTSDDAGEALGGASRLIRDPARIRWTDNEEVELVAVDEIVGGDRRVAAIHLDVEGHEQEALIGAMRTIERCRPLIVLESVPEERWMAANLTPLGYKVDGSVDINCVLRSSAPIAQG